MNNDTTSRNRGSKKNLEAILKKEAIDERESRRAKRHAQHEHWMRVMKDGQSTPDLSYQKTE